MVGLAPARTACRVALLLGLVVHGGCDRKTPDEVGPEADPRPASVKFNVAVPAVGDRFTWTAEEKGQLRLGKSTNIHSRVVADVEVLSSGEWGITSARVHVRENETELIDEAGVHTPIPSLVLGSTYLLSWTKDDPLRATHVQRGAVKKDELVSLERFMTSMRDHSAAARMLDGRSLTKGERLMPLPEEEVLNVHEGVRRTRRHDFEFTLTRVADGTAHLDVSGAVETFAARDGVQNRAKLTQTIEVATEGPVRWSIESDVEAKSRAGSGPAIMARGHVSISFTPMAS
ncbi:MAG: hypothetical protein AAF799_00465 [Myxococcota bacterium]